MIFTIGDPRTYEDLLDINPNASKGKSGCVFETFEKAKVYRDDRAPHFNIYGVEAWWTEDTEEAGLNFRVLKRAAKLIRIPQQ